jgi:hypothetical protein
MRLARQYVWLFPADCDPPHGLDMEPGGRDDVKVAHLEDQFRHSGFDLDYPALVGYPLNGRVQLLSGTHRHRAASRIDGFLLPVTLFLSSDVRTLWGTERWAGVMADIPVRRLEQFAVLGGGRAPDISEMVDIDQR